MTNIRKKRILRRAIYSIGLIFFLMNVMAFFHAYKFTHFTSKEVVRTSDPGKLNSYQKIKTLFFGVDNPRPINKVYPPRSYETILIKSNKQIECWYVPRPQARGTVIIFHGFSGYKSTMLDKAEELYKLGYSTMLVDFMGSGGSEGNQTTIGFFESSQVKSALEFLQQRGEKNIFLFGTSMGAVAIMKSIHDFDIQPAGIILECPFGSMYKTVSARFKIMNAPSFPMAGLLVFWGGVQNGFWAFGHNPVDYAKSIRCATLLLYGAKDPKVSLEETNEMFSNIKGPKYLKIYPEAGHEDLLNTKTSWSDDVDEFLTVSATKY